MKTTLDELLYAAVNTCDAMNKEGKRGEARAFAVFAQYLDLAVQKRKRAERKAIRDERDNYNEALGDGQR